MNIGEWGEFKGWVVHLPSLKAGIKEGLRVALAAVEKADYDNSCGSGCGSAMCVYAVEQLVDG